MKDEEMFETNLERCSYRFLQQTAKAMGLPANVKKVYLIKLINARNYGTPRDLDSLVRHVRSEQKYQAQRRAGGSNKRQQSQEISSTSQSPPITHTPRRVGHRPEVQSPQPSRRHPAIGSDRVLRSSNRITKPSYLLNNTLMSLMAVPDERSETRRKSSTDEIRKSTRSFAKEIIVSLQKDGKVVSVRRANNSPPPSKQPRRLSGIYPLQPEDIKKPCVVVRRPDGSFTQINAIYRSQLAQNRYDRQKQFDTLNPYIVRANATISVMTKTVQNSNISSNFSEINYNSNNVPSNLRSNTCGSSNISEMTNKCLSNIPNAGIRTHRSETAQNVGYKTSVTEVSPTNNFRATNNVSFSSGSDETTLSNSSRESLSAFDGEYYHKKIRAERRSSRKSSEIARTVENECSQITRTIENECSLPKINEVFTQFGSVYSGDIMQPLYVQVDSEPAIAPNPPKIPEPRIQHQGTSSLESIYNLKMLHQPTPRHSMSKMTDTQTVYCTPVICSTMALPSSTGLHNQNNVYDIASLPRESQPYFQIQNKTEVIPIPSNTFSNFHCHGENNIGASTPYLGRSYSSVETISSQEQELSANLSIPEMVEDAMEIISQDGDYMERIGMDIRMQCILCHWAGPKIVLEYHIRKDHAADIVECQSNEFSTSYSLGKLAARRVWLSTVLQHEGALYVLSAKYEDPDCFMATLSTVSYNLDDPKTGSLTTYNKVTGEPFTWTGLVTNLPPCMPYENAPDCFRLEISKMDLLPNSANLKLHNRELVLRSPSKVVVGQPELNDIHITVTVKILN